MVSEGGPVSAWQISLYRAIFRDISTPVEYAPIPFGKNHLNSALFHRNLSILEIVESIESQIQSILRVSSCSKYGFSTRESWSAVSLGFKCSQYLKLLPLALVDIIVKINFPSTI